MSQSPEPNSNQNSHLEQHHLGSGDNVANNKNVNSYYSEIGGDFNVIEGNVTHQYIITQQSSIEIKQRELITGSPYKGLEKFEEGDKDKFFGRDSWIVELTNHLIEKNVLLLLGASGSGKSSLVQAGLIPKLKDHFGSNQLVNLTFVPDVNPFESFYLPLAIKYGQAEAKLSREVAEETLVKVVQALRNESQWLIFIDQFEELFTRTPKRERNVFINSLIQLIGKQDHAIKIVMTMRADFLDKISPYPSLGNIYQAYNCLLMDMEDSELRLAIAEPAARNGVIFEQGLIEQIIDDFKQQAGSLPLLQYTLDLLWNKSKHEIEKRILKRETYQQLGGVTGALQQQANKIYDSFNEQQQKVAEQIFLELISLEGKEPVSRRVDKTIFEGDKTQKEVLYELIDNRLLVSKGEDGKATVEVAHEALIRSWKVLTELIREKETIIILRNRLYADAKQWDEVRKNDLNRAKGELWRGSKLAKIIELRKEKALPNLDEVTIEFIEASIEEREHEQRAELERQKRDKRNAQRIAAGSLIAVLINSSLGWMAWQKTKQAELNEAESLGRYALSLVRNEGRDLDGFMAAIKAQKILQKHDRTNPVVINALQQLLNDRKERNRFIDHQSWVSSVAITPDGKTLVSGSEDNTIKVWDIDLDSLMQRSCDWVRDYLENPYSDVKEEDRGVCDGI